MQYELGVYPGKLLYMFAGGPLGMEEVGPVLYVFAGGPTGVEEDGTVLYVFAEKPAGGVIEEDGRLL